MVPWKAPSQTAQSVDGRLAQHTQLCAVNVKDAIQLIDSNLKGYFWDHLNTTADLPN